ncbi:MAG: peptide-methionine (S)-S-oxide reductase [Myxococcota bacterium]|jgi:peptide-methionine (S)-S-oxide reductase
MIYRQCRHPWVATVSHAVSQRLLLAVQGGAMFWRFDKTSMVAPADALPGRTNAMITAEVHFVSGRPLAGPVPEGLEEAVFGLGCFWGAERVFWQATGVWVTAVGYAAGHTPNPTYEEVCSGRTGHNEVVRVVFDPSIVSFAALCRLFFESHDPTQGMRQGNDAGTQYRSGIYCTSPEQRDVAEAAKLAYAPSLREAGYGPVTTEVLEVGTFFYAEEYHQQYLAKNPGGYCGIGGTGVSCPIGLGVEG